MNILPYHGFFYQSFNQGSEPLLHNPEVRDYLQTLTEPEEQTHHLLTRNTILFSILTIGLISLLSRLSCDSWKSPANIRDNMGIEQELPEIPSQHPDKKNNEIINNPEIIIV